LRGEKAAGCVGVWQHSTRAREDETRETPKLELPTATSVTTFVKSAVESARALDRGAVGENFRDPSARKVGSIRNRALIGRFESVRNFKIGSEEYITSPTHPRSVRIGSSQHSHENEIPKIALKSP
jgi:hypothetical protein